MTEYFQFAVLWVLFMVLIVAITLIVPKLAKKIDKCLDQKRANAPKEMPQTNITNEESENNDVDD